MRMVGLAGLHRQRDRAICADRRCRPERAETAGKTWRHGCLEGGAALHAMGRRHAWAASRSRVYRISFSGELSYEIAVPASHGAGLLGRACIAAGEDFGVMPYGTEALHVHARREGLHHDRRRNRRHGDPAGPGSRLGDLEEEGRLPRQARRRSARSWPRPTAGSWSGSRRSTDRSFPTAPMRWPTASTPTASATCRVG